MDAAQQRRRRTPIDGEPAPDRNDEYRFYQALVGVLAAGRRAGAAAAPPTSAARMQAYMLKAVREAKVHTSWLTPNQHYEDALKTFVERVLDRPGRQVPAGAPALPAAGRRDRDGELAVAGRR